MNQSQPQINKLAMLYWTILGIALGWGGMFYTFVSVLGIYLLLTRLRPGARFELMIVASAFSGMAVVQVFHTILRPNLFSIDHLLEPIVVAGLAIVLLFNPKRVWAWCLIVYSTVIGVLSLYVALHHLSKESRPQFQFANAVISAILIWLLVCWLHKQSPNDSDIRSV
ncbi:MAG: hypothetical protein ABSH11_05675 [Verrucomicrobiota bacterium]